MTVYVDPVFRAPWNKHWPWKWACHMFGEDPVELRELADRIGLKPEWFQDHHAIPHYDLTRSKRAEALAAGAVEASRADVVAYLRIRCAQVTAHAKKRRYKRRNTKRGNSRTRKKK